MIARTGHRLATCIVVLGVAIGAAAPVSAATEPDIVLDEVRKAERQCREMDGRPHKGPNFLRVQDLNGDGGEDWILDYTRFECRGAIPPQLFCGSGGCSLQIFLWSGGSTWRLALDELVQSYRVTKVDGKPALELGLGGATCGKANFQTCRRNYLFRDGRLVPAR